MRLGHLFGGIKSFVDKKILESIKQSLKEDYEKVVKANKIKNDDIKTEALRFIGIDYRTEVAETIKDENKRALAIMLLDEPGQLEIADTISVLDEISEESMKAEIIIATIEKSESQEIIKEIEEQLEITEEIKRESDEEKKIKALDNIYSEYLKVEVVLTMRPEKRIELLHLFKEDCYKAKIILTLEDDKKIKLLPLLEESYYITEVIKSIDDTKKIELLSSLELDDIDKSKIIKSIENEQERIDSLKFIEDNRKKAEIIATITDDAVKVNLLNLLELEDADKVIIIRSIKEDSKKIELLEILDSEKDKERVIDSIKDENKKMDMIKRYFTYEGLEEYFRDREYFEDESLKEIESLIEKVEECKKTKNYNKKKEFLDNEENENLKIEIISTIQDVNKKKEEIEKLSPNGIKSYRKNSGDLEFIKNNIQMFAQLEGFRTEISDDLIEELYKKNNFVVQNIDFRLLDSKYVTLLGKDKINLISCYQSIQRNVLSLDEKQIRVFSECINNFIQENETEEWTVLASEMLNNILKGEHNSLIESINNLEELNQKELNNLTQILQNSNFCNITDVNQVKEFEKILEEKCKSIIESENATLSHKKAAVIQKIFGHDMNYANGIIERFGEDIENVNESDSKDYVRCLKLIENIKDEEVLKRIFYECEHVKTNKVIVERKLKNEYCKMFNEGLYVPKESDLVPGQSNVYEAGTDFKIIITALAALNPNNPDVPENYKEDWNRPAISTQHFCTSYIRNDMIGTAPIKNICYGFYGMKEDSLVLSGEKNIGSGSNKFVSSSRSEKYYTPEQQINNTNDFNEVDYRRIQGGEKKQPDYLIVFRKDGKIKNMSEAQKASKDWGGMPIVVIDIDKCLTSEQEKVKEMMRKYNEQPTKQLAEQIRIKIRNNRVTDKKFCDDIDIEQLNLEVRTEKVGKEELEENYKRVSANERETEMTKIQNIYRMLQEMIRGERHER